MKMTILRIAIAVVLLAVLTVGASTIPTQTASAPDAIIAGDAPICPGSAGAAPETHPPFGGTVSPDCDDWNGPIPG